MPDKKPRRLYKKGFFLRLRSRIRNTENRGDLAEIRTSLNHIATSGRLSAFRKKCNRGTNRPHWVRVSCARWRFFSVRVVNYAEKNTEATLTTWHPAQFFCRPWYILRVHCHFRRKSNPAGPAKIGPRSGFSSATGCFLVCGQLRRESNHGDAAVAATSLT